MALSVPKAGTTRGVICVGPNATDDNHVSTNEDHHRSLVLRCLWPTWGPHPRPFAVAFVESQWTRGGRIEGLRKAKLGGVFLEKQKKVFSEASIGDCHV